MEKAEVMAVSLRLHQQQVSGLPSIGSLLGQRRRRWVSSEPTDESTSRVCWETLININRMVINTMFKVKLSWLCEQRDNRITDILWNRLLFKTL